MEYLDSRFDEQFSKIENLTWHPWVGKDYVNSKRKVLLVGQSQYATDEKGNFDENTAQDFKKETTTREYAYNTISLEEEPAKFYNQLFKIFEVYDKGRKEFWSKVAYYHFFQDVDKQVSANKHLKQERMSAWKTWGNIVDLIKPDICIFLGKGMYHYYDIWSNENNIRFEWKDIENTGFACKPIKGIFENNNTSLNVKFLFIKHPSWIFDVKGWNNFLKEQIPEIMQFLNSK